MAAEHQRKYKRRLRNINGTAGVCAKTTPKKAATAMNK
jgi:hypothetical protein